VQKAVGGVKLYDCIGVIGVERGCPTVDDDARLFGWARSTCAGKSIRSATKE
jgi:hypothetical protein